MSLHWAIEGIKEALCASEHHLSLGLGSLSHVPSTRPSIFPGWICWMGLNRGGILSLFSPRWLQERRPLSPSLWWPISIVNMTLPLTRGRWCETESFPGLLCLPLWRATASGGGRERQNPMRDGDGGGRRGGRGQRQSRITTSLGLAQMHATESLMNGRT
jgi:hypothetical protein